jgi:magnesium transporter
MAVITTPIDELLAQWPSMESTERMDAFRMLPYELHDDFFLELDARNQLELLESLSPGERRLWLRLLAPDDAADVIQLADTEDRAELIAQLDDVGKREVNALLAYEEDEAGGLMSPRFVRLRPDMTVD